MHSTPHRNCALFFGLLLFAPLAQAQQQQQQQQQEQQQQTQPQQSQTPQQSTEQPSQPIPAYHSPLASLAGGSEEDQTPDSSEVVPDNLPLAGAQDVRPGMPRTERSYWQPSFTINSTFDSNALNSTGSSGWAAYTSIFGSLDVHRVSGVSDLSVTYSGGGIVSSDSNVGNSVIQDFGFGERIALRRNVISIFDQLSYIPEAGFGYGGDGGFGLLGGLGLQSGFEPSESILTAREQRLSNTSIAQWETDLTPRSSLTFLGGYSILHFFGSDYINSGNAFFQGGYSYQLSRTDTIAVLYNFAEYGYSGFGGSYYDSRVNVAYAKRVTGRLALQIAGGPEFLTVHGAPSGSGGLSLGTSGSKTNWSLHTALSYAVREGTVGLTYDHGVNGGSGVLLGAVGNTVAASANRTFTRVFSGGLQTGYSRNTAVNGEGQSYSYWFGGGNVSRLFGPYIGLALAYQFQYQDSNQSFCVGASCGDSITRQTITIGVSWHDHRLAF